MLCYNRRSREVLFASSYLFVTYKTSTRADFWGLFSFLRLIARRKNLVLTTSTDFTCTNQADTNYPIATKSRSTYAALALGKPHSSLSSCWQEVRPQARLGRLMTRNTRSHGVLRQISQLWWMGQVMCGAISTVTTVPR